MYNLPHIIAWYGDYKSKLTKNAIYNIERILKSLDNEGKYVYKNRNYGGFHENDYNKYKNDIQLVMYNYRNVIKRK